MTLGAVVRADVGGASDAGRGHQGSRNSGTGSEHYASHRRGE
jgi:hypothetical protein